MWPHLQAIPLVTAYSGIIKYKKIQKEPIQLENGSRALLFYPMDKKPNELPGVYIQHGMSVLGIDDPRILILAENMAFCGFSVILPELREVCSLKIDTKTILNIETLILLLHKKSWYNGKKFGYLSASFSGGMGLIAISKPHLSHLVDAIMVIGAYSDFLDTLAFVFSNYHRDNYGVNVLLYNYIDRIEPNLSEELKPIFFEAAKDNALHRIGEDSQAPKLVKKLSTQSRKFYYDFEAENNFRTDVGRRILNKIGDLPISLSPHHQLENIHCPVVLLHGEDDPVISPQESQKLSELFAKKEISFLYRTSSSITHGDNLPLHSQIFGVPALLETFGTFIQTLKK